MILMYHKVHPVTPTMWWVSVNQFHRQMLELQSREIVYLDDYDPKNEKHVVITFDGVYQNVLRFAAPFLRKFGYPFELFVTSEFIGGTNEFDSVEPVTEFAGAEELTTLIKMGGRLQWHSKSHIDLSSVRDAAVIDRELEIPDDIKALDANMLSVRTVILSENRLSRLPDMVD